MLIGFPVAFSLAACGLLFGFHRRSTLGFFPPDFSDDSACDLRHPVERSAAGDSVLHLHGGDSRTLRAGRGSARRHRTVVRSVPGGLAYAVIFVGAILGAITGTVAASVIAMGVISLPIMLRYGYNPRVATGVIAASGTITQLIPPSLVLIVLADQIGSSVGDMYTGAIRPFDRSGPDFHGSSFCWCRCSVRRLMPPLPREARTLRGWALWSRVLWGMVPSIVLIFLVLGTILLGLATPTEAGAMGAVGAIVLAAHASSTDLAAGASGDGIDDAPDGDGDLHPDRLDDFHAGVSGRRRQHVDRAHAGRRCPAGNRISDRRSTFSSSCSPSFSTSSRSRSSSCHCWRRWPTSSASI